MTNVATVSVLVKNEAFNDLGILASGGGQQSLIHFNWSFILAESKNHIQSLASAFICF